MATRAPTPPTSHATPADSAERPTLSRAPEAGSGFSVTDYLQLAGMARRTIMLSLHDAAGRLLGRVFVMNGEPRWAQDRFGVGEGAFRRLALLEDAEVRCNPVDVLPANFNLSGNLTQLLMAAAQYADESRYRGQPAATRYVDSAVRPIPAPAAVECVELEVLRDVLKIYSEHLGPAAKLMFKQQLAELGYSAQSLPQTELVSFVERLTACIPTLSARQGFSEALSVYWQRFA